MDSIRIRIWSVIHKTDDFYIFSAEPCDRDILKHDRKVTCKGRLFGILGIAPGIPLELFGRWVFHPKFGRQFDLSGWAPWADSSVGVELFFRHCLGVIDEVQIASLVDDFGTDTYRVLSEEPNRLFGVVGFDEESAQRVIDAWAEARTSSDLSTFFSGYNVTSEQMNNLFRTFGADAKRIVEGNPYRLLEVVGFLFHQVDEIAQSLGLTLTDPRRFEGAVFWVLREAASYGHLCVRRGELASQLKELVRVTSEVTPFEEYNLSSALMDAVKRIESRNGVVVDPRLGVYLPKLFKFERDSANLLSKFIAPVKLEVDLPHFLGTYETLHQIILSEAQKEAVEKLVNNRVLVLTGLPGTGKTTVVKTFVKLFEEAKISFVLMAPTGIASKRLASVTGHEAATIHRTLHYNGETWGYNRDNKYPIGAVVVDEASMVDQELFYHILDALEDGTMLVLVGDDAQLPSVGPGNVLRELVRCPVIPTVRLTQIFRQAEQSDIILNSHRINRGESIVPGGSESDFRFVPIQDEGKIADLIVQMAIKLKSRDANFQILSPKYDGLVGVTHLNDRLREVLNPAESGKKEFLVGGDLKFREGDRLMVVKNDYKLGVYNGDMGKLLQVQYDHFRVKIHGIGEDGLDVIVEIPRKEVLQKLRLAYAISVHKSQGSEFDTIILPMVRTHGRMLQRNLFYTAVTRAKKCVWLLGDSTSIQRAIQNDNVILRNTGFGRAILSAVASEDVHETVGLGVMSGDEQFKVASVGGSKN